MTRLLLVRHGETEWNARRVLQGQHDVALSLRGQKQAADLAAMHAALMKVPGTTGFMNSAAPGVISLFQPNEHYATQDDYLEALAEAMRPEYEAIVASGLVLQIDSPDLGLGRHTMYKGRSEDEYLDLAARHVEVLNHALRNIPADKVRLYPDPMALLRDYKPGGKELVLAARISGPVKSAFGDKAPDDVTADPAHIAASTSPAAGWS